MYSLSVRVETGVRDVFGQTLQAPHSLRFTGRAPYVPPKEDPLGREEFGGPALFATGEHAALSAVVVSRPGAIFRTARVEIAQLLAALEQELHPERDLGQFRDLRTTELPVKPGVSEKFSLPIPEGRGFWLTQIEMAPVGARPALKLAQLVQVTSIALLVAVDSEEMVASAGTLRDHAPLPGARISLYQGSRLLMTREADAQGLARFPSRDALRTKEELILVAEADGDRCFYLASNPFTGKYGEPNDPFRTTGLTGAIWTERPVYRPGEIAHVFGVLRTQGPRGKLVAAPESVHWQAGRLGYRDVQKADIVAEGDARPTAAGIVSFDIAIPKDLQLGFLPIHIGDVRGGLKIFEGRIPEARVEVKIVPGQHRVGGEARAEIAAATWFGAPLSHAKVLWKVVGFEASHHALNQPGFSIGWEPRPGEEDAQPHRNWDWQSEERGESALDDDGKLRLAVKLSPACANYGACELIVEAEVVDSLQHGVNASAWLLALRSPYAIALRGRTDDRVIHVDAMAIDEQGQEVKAPPIEVRLYERRSVKDPGAGPQSEEVELFRAFAPATFTAPYPGHFIARASVPSLRADEPRASTEIYIHDREQPLELTADKASYKPGEIAHLSLSGSAAGGAGLLLVDHGGTIETRAIAAGQRRFDLLVKEEWIATVSVTARVVSGGEGEMAQTRLSIDRETRALPVFVAVSSKDAAPGQTVEVTVRAAPGAGVVVSVVDEGALAMVRTQPFDALEALYPAKFPWYRFDWRTLLDDLRIDRYAYLRSSPEEHPRRRAAGEDIVVTGSRVRESEPKPSFALRSEFRPTAFFSADLRTDASGTAKVAVKLPDQAGAFRVFAFAVEALPRPRLGSAETQLRVSLPLLLRPSLPRFVDAGDRFEVTAQVHNLTAGEVRATVRAGGENLAVESAAKIVSLPAGKSRTVSFFATATAPGIASVRFEVEGAGRTDAVRLELPVQRPVAAETFTSYGATEDAVRIPLAIPQGALPGEGGLQISLSASALEGLRDAAGYMLDYPYDCVEQTASRLIALSAVRDLPVTVPDRKERVRLALARLRSLQLPSGGFGYWPGSEENPYGTAWAAFALSLVDDHDSYEARELLQRTKERLRQMRGQWPAEAALLALLAAEDRDEALVSRIFAARPALSLFARALLLEVLTRDDDQRGRAVKAELLDEAHETAAALHFEERPEKASLATFDSRDREDAAVLHALLAARSKEPAVAKLVRGVLANRRNGHWQTTQSNAWSLLALANQARKESSKSGSFEAGVWLGERSLLAHSFEGKPGEAAGADVPMASLISSADAPLVVGKKGEGQLHYRLALTAVRPAQDAWPISHGLRLTRTLEDRDGRPLQQPVAAGAVVRVHLRLEAQGPHPYVAVADHLPAGLEPLDPHLATTAGLPKVPADRRWSYTELRDGGARAFVDYLSGGSIDFVYFARAATKGRFSMPAAEAEEMYAPETSARTEPSALTIE